MINDLQIYPIQMINDLQIYPLDIGKFNWYVANKLCQEIGDGWRLPTDIELNLIYENRDTIAGISDGDYWSSISGILETRARGQYFANGDKFVSSKSLECWTRPVRFLQ